MRGKRSVLAFELIEDVPADRFLVSDPGNRFRNVRDYFIATGWHFMYNRNDIGE